MKRILIKFKELKNRILERRIYRHYYYNPRLFEDVDLKNVPRSSFSMEL